MRIPRLALSLLVFPMVAAACGDSSTAGTSSQPATAAASSAAATSAAATSAAAAAADVLTGQATVSGSSVTVLTSAQGMTLYYRPGESASNVTCTGSCAANWPPLLKASGSPTAASGVSGTLTVFSGPNGSQVAYNGHPLYLWVHDTAAGQATGDGVGGFKVATPSLSA